VNDLTYYADTDFILAIIKEDDWLQSNAKQILDENRGEIVTSAITFLETVLVLEKSGIDEVAPIFEDILGFVEPLEVDDQTLLQAAFYIRDGANPFDAFHIAIAGNKKIISSDKEFDKLGVERLKLEEKQS